MYVVAPGQVLIHSGVRYPAGAVAPDSIDPDPLIEVGVLVEEADEKPPRPEPEPEKATTSIPGFDKSDPGSITNVPIRVLPALLRTIEDADLLLELHEADTRKGGKDAIEERLGELEVS